MGVRAKFKCCSKETSSLAAKCGTVKLEPVVNGSDENESFYKYTPGGQITLSTVNEEAFAQFEVGKEYYVDFAPAEAEAEA